MADSRLAIDGGKPVRKDFLIFGKPCIKDEEIREVVDTLKSGWLAAGPKVSRFEKMFSEFTHSKYALGLNSCTAGLSLALEVLGIGERDEVITTPITFAATANVIVHRGAKPVFVDVNLKTMNIDPDKIEKALTKRTKAIIPVHFAGRPCDMDEITKIARKYSIFVVEDAAHATEAEYKGKKIGSIGDITAFSFYATKNMATGEGGMVTTNNRKWFEKMCLLALHGLDRDAWNRYSKKGFKHYEVICPGYNYRMADIEASLGIHQLRRLMHNLRIREALWQRYNRAFKQIKELTTPAEDKDIRHARHLYTILLDIEHLTLNRNEFIKALKAENIGAAVHFSALHLHNYYRKRYGFKKGDFPNAEFISERILSLPLTAGMTEKDADDVIAAVTKIVKSSYSRRRLCS